MGTSVYAEGIPPRGAVRASDLEALRAAAEVAGAGLAWGCEDFRVPAEVDEEENKVLIATKILTADDTHFDRDLAQFVALVTCLSRVRPTWTWVLTDEVEALTVDLEADAIYVRNGRAVESSEPDAEPDEAAQAELDYWCDEVTLAPVPKRARGGEERLRGPGRRFECVEGSASKFWEIHVDGTAVTTNWGKLGTRGQEKVAGHPSDEAAAKDAEKQVRAKVAKGYVELPPEAPSIDAVEAPSVAPPVPVETRPVAPPVPVETRPVAPPAPISAPNDRRREGRFARLERASVSLEVEGPDSDGEYRVRVAGEIHLEPALHVDTAGIELELRSARNEIVYSDDQGVAVEYPRGDRVPFSVVFFPKGRQFTRAVRAHVYARARVFDVDGPASFALGADGGG